MNNHCYRCNEDISDSKISRKDECPKCKSDLHVCKNCTFYDSAAYNECKESQAERVLDKERGNFCDYFVFRESTSGSSIDGSKQSALKKLDDLFK